MRMMRLSVSRWLSWAFRVRNSGLASGRDENRLTHSGVLYVTDDGKHIIQGPMYDVSGAHPVNVTNKLLMSQLNALEKEMIVYKAPDEKHVITVLPISPAAIVISYMKR